jgi:hypothetical protein
MVIDKYNILYTKLVIMYAIFIPKGYFNLTYLISGIYKSGGIFFKLFQSKKLNNIQIIGLLMIPGVVNSFRGVKL